MARLFIACVVTIGTLLGLAGSAHAENLKMATLAPRESAWGKVFSAWSKAVKSESNGSLELTWYWNGAQGDEAAMIGKIRSRQIDGGAFTAAGLTRITPQAIAFQMPGLFSGWPKLDAARDATRSKLDREFDAAGFRILGTGDVGVAHYMSRGRPVRTPADLKSMHPFFVSGDVVNQKILETVGVPSPRALAVPAILPALAAHSQGAVYVINTPTIAAEQLQWTAHVDHINTMPTTYTIGALVIDKHAFEALPADARALLERTGANTGKVLTARIRGVDKAAFDRAKKTKTVIDPTPAELAAWNDLFARVRTTLKAEGKIRADIFDEVVAAGQ